MQELEKQLNCALKDTFPASDPVSIGEPTGDTPDRPAERRAPVIDRKLVDKLAQEVRRKQQRKVERKAG
jgi:hypothetical protein